MQGGRLDVVEGRTVAAVVDARPKHLISVFIRPTPEADAVPAGGARRGYNWIAWRKSGMASCAVSDVAAGDLVELSRLLTR